MKKLFSRLKTMAKTIRNGFHDWYNGKVVHTDPIITDSLVFINFPEVKRHWTSRAVNTLMSFLRAYWQWCITTIVFVYINTRGK